MSIVYNMVILYNQHDVYSDVMYTWRVYCNTLISVRDFKIL